MKAKIAVILTTRGLIYARTIKSLQENGLYNYIIIDGLGIPDAQNEGVKRAMKTDADRFLFIEDDIEIPKNTISAILSKDNDIVCVDYSVNGISTVKMVNNEIWWCALGCTMIKRRVFERVKLFDTSYSWKIEEPFKLVRQQKQNKYGGQDINFMLEAKLSGFKIEKVDGMLAKHLRCKNLIREENNNTGSYNIYELELKKYQDEESCNYKFI